MLNPTRWTSAIAVVVLGALVASAAAPSFTAGPGPEPAGATDPWVIQRYDWGRTGRAPFVSDITDPAVRWTFSISGEAVHTPLVADADDDGAIEVLVAAGDVLYALDQDGSPEWSATMNSPSLAGASAAGDIDGDGLTELVVVEGSHFTEGGLRIYSVNGEDGSVNWQFTSTSLQEEGFVTSPILYDISGDDILDVLLGSMDDTFYAFDGPTGSVLWQSVPFTHYIRTSSPMADFDGDGDHEIVAIDDRALVRTFDAVTGAVEMEVDLGEVVGATPAVGDLDGDGEPETAFFMVASGGAVVLDSDGSVLWQDTAYDAFYHSPTLVDVDGDGLLDVIGGDSNDHTLIAYRGYDGAILWTTTLPIPAWSQAALVSADIDGDGIVEILAGADPNVFAVNADDGSLDWVFEVPKVRGQPTVADLDLDGIAEILVPGGDGVLYVLEQAQPPAFEPRSKGYWKRQCQDKPLKGNHTGISQEWVDAIADQSDVFDGLASVDDACALLTGKPGSDMEAKARQQLLALWLNVVSGKVDMDAPVDLPALTTATTVAGAIADIEAVVLAGDATQMERAKDLADALNNGDNGVP